MPPVGFEPTISAGERPKTYALDRAATGTGIINLALKLYLITYYHSSFRTRKIGDFQNRYIYVNFNDATRSLDYTTFPKVSGENICI